MRVDVEVNVLDSTGDRILAGEELTKEAVPSPGRLSSLRSLGQCPENPSCGA
jgi:hypothetical protein